MKFSIPAVLSTLTLTVAAQTNAAVAKDAMAPVPVAVAALPKSPVPFSGCAYLELAMPKGAITATVGGPVAGFYGLVLLSLSPQTAYVFADLPPLLTDTVVMGVGKAGGYDLQLQIRRPPVPFELPVYGQALVLDSWGLSMSGIVEVRDPAAAPPKAVD